MEVTALVSLAISTFEAINAFVRMLRRAKNLTSLQTQVLTEIDDTMLLLIRFRKVREVSREALDGYGALASVRQTLLDTEKEGWRAFNSLNNALARTGSKLEVAIKGELTTDLTEALNVMKNTKTTLRSAILTQGMFLYLASSEDRGSLKEVVFANRGLMPV